MYLRVRFNSYLAFLNVKLAVLHCSCTLPRRRLNLNVPCTATNIHSSIHAFIHFKGSLI